MLGFPHDSMVKNPPAMQEIVSIPVSGKSPGGGHGNPLQYFFLENPMDRGVFQAVIYGVLKRVRHG